MKATKGKRGEPTEPAAASDGGVVWRGAEALRALLRPIADLKLDPNNARAHAARDIAAVQASLARFGQRKPIVVRDGVVIAGNGTMEAARRAGFTHFAVAEANDLTEIEARAYSIADNRTAELSEWNFDRLAEELPMLAEFDLGFSPDDVASVLSGNGLSGAEPSADGDTYTTKVVSPIYLPKNTKPTTSDLFDKSKTMSLQARIASAAIDDREIVDFLMRAAERHTVFNFDKIADFYANSNAEVQRLFEDSALVIVDFNRAIELGFVKMDNAIMGLTKVEAGDDDA